MSRLRLFLVSGSLRARSSSTAVLKAVATLARDRFEVDFYDGIDRLPYFSPDRDAAGVPLPPAVADLRRRVGVATHLIIACPEYAHGIPGAFKNALDWLVGSSEFPGKTVVLFQATTRGEAVKAALSDVLRTMSAQVRDDAECALPLVGKDATPDMILCHPEWRGVLERAIERL